MDTQEITRWALRVPLPAAPSRAIGAGHVGRILVALVQYANADGIAFPAAQTLADDVSGMTRRGVRNALDALVDAGIIEYAEPPRQGRVARWRLNLAGYPATPKPGGVSRQARGKPDAGRRQLGGELGGVSRREEEEEVEEEENKNDVQRFAPHVHVDDDLFGRSEVGSAPSVVNAPAARADDDDARNVSEIGERPTVGHTAPPEDDEPATAEQIEWLRNAHIHRHSVSPSLTQFTKWRAMASGAAQRLIDDHLQVIAKRHTYGGPERGTDLYRELSALGRHWADSRTVPHTFTTADREELEMPA